jgi:phospholipid/cholesterol/gamma-HCH transport system permease protein
MVSCYQGFHCAPGAEGVGQAATKSFVYSFIVILIMDLLIGIAVEAIYQSIWPDGPRLF